MNLKEKLKQKLDEQAALLGVAVTESRGMSVEEQTKFDALEVEIKSLETTIQAQEKVSQREKELNTPVNEPVLPAVPGATASIKNDKKWKSFGELLKAVQVAGTPGERIDQRLMIGIKQTASGSSEAINSDGGFLVDEQYVSELLTRTYDLALVADKVRKIPIGDTANTLRINGIDETSRANGSRWGGVQAYWTGEANTVTATKPKFREIVLKLEKLMSLCYATDELLQDAVALEGVIRQAFSEEMAFKLDDAFINGTGGGMPLGILPAPCTYQVAKQSGQSAATIVYENILNMWTHMWGRSRQNAVWFINQEIEPQLNTMSLVIGTAGVPVYMPANGANGLPYSILFGRPVIPIEQCSALGTPGDIILADMTQYLAIDKGDITPATSVHVRFLYDEQVFRLTYRVNGMPIWHAPLSPFKGSNIVSPFVTLAQRS